MPRIRTIKPEFWSDEKVGKLKRDVRLLFIGLLNFADDYGTVRANAVWIKSQVFPYDEDLRMDVLTKWLAALVDARMLEPFNHNGESFYNIRTFLSHQKVEKPSRPIVPLEEKQRLLEYSPNTPRGLSEGSALEIGNRKGEKEVGEGGSRAPARIPPPPPPIAPAWPQPSNYSRPQTAPSFEQVQECFARLDKPSEARGFFDYYEGLNWHKGNTPIVNWTAFANRWAAGDSPTINRTTNANQSTAPTSEADAWAASFKAAEERSNRGRR